MTEDTEIDGWREKGRKKNAGAMLRLEHIPDKQLESLFDCDEGTY